MIRWLSILIALISGCAIASLSAAESPWACLSKPAATKASPWACLPAAPAAPAPVVTPAEPTTKSEADEPVKTVPGPYVPAREEPQQVCPSGQCPASARYAPATTNSKATTQSSGGSWRWRPLRGWRYVK